MKGITKDSEALRKITKVFFTVGKTNVKRFRITFQVLHSISPVLAVGLVLL